MAKDTDQAQVAHRQDIWIKLVIVSFQCLYPKPLQNLTKAFKNIVERVATPGG